MRKQQGEKASSHGMDTLDEEVAMTKTEVRGSAPSLVLAQQMRFEREGNGLFYIGRSRVDDTFCTNHEVLFERHGWIQLWRMY